MNNVALVDYAWPFWILWLVIFLVFEFTAIFLRSKFTPVNDNGGTFSELIWFLIRGKAWWHHLLYFVLLGFFVDLGFHFFVGTNLWII